MSATGTPDGWYALDSDTQIGLMAWWRIRHAHKVSAARERAAARGDRSFTAEDLRMVLTSPASLSDITHLWNITHGGGGKPSPKPAQDDPRARFAAAMRAKGVSESTLSRFGVV